MQNRRQQENKPETSEDQLFRRLVIILLLVFVFVAIVFGIYQGIKILRTPDTEGTPTSESLSPALQATASAACAIFMQQFPGTPCPEQIPQDIISTATAACLQFQSQFPGTPCP